MACYENFIFKFMKNPRKQKSDFFEMVFEVVRLIPKGYVTSYGAIGNYLGLKSSARMVGWAMNKSRSYKYPVPAHRVLNRNGDLTGKHHFENPKMMQQLLESEGIKVSKDRVMGFDKIFWDPAVKLE